VGSDSNNGVRHQRALSPRLSMMMMMMCHNHAVYNNPLAMCDVAVQCPRLVFRVVSSNSTSVGTLVNVSCPADQKLQTGHLMTQTLCSRSGDWTPAVPDCVGKLLEGVSKLSKTLIYLWQQNKQWK